MTFQSELKGITEQRIIPSSLSIRIKKYQCLNDENELFYSMYINYLVGDVLNSSIVVNVFNFINISSAYL